VVKIYLCGFDGLEKNLTLISGKWPQSSQIGLENPPMQPTRNTWHIGAINARIKLSLRIQWN
jgi:hypothetical protein